MEFNHYSVLKNESISALNINPDGVYVDATLGGGGHSLEIAKKLQSGRLIGIDRDIIAIKAAKERLLEFSDKVLLVKNNFSQLTGILSDLKIDGLDGIIFDLGVSSPQLDNSERGFSYHNDAPLDMRMDREATLDAHKVVNTYPRARLSEVILKYGEERYAGRIAAAICKRRELEPINTTGQLCEIIKSVFPPSERYSGKHPAKRTFQAIRIEVNNELDMLEQALTDAISALKKGGRIAVITFHSLEDRITKRVFNRYSSGCVCDKSFPICVCGQKPIIKTINRKPIVAGQQELSVNSRSKPAKLRIGEKL